MRQELADDRDELLTNAFNVLLLIEHGLDEPMAKRISDQWQKKCAELKDARTPAQGALKLGDMVQVNERAPFFSDWRGATMKVVSLRIDPEGKQWVSVIEGKPHHRGNGVYDGETTDFDAEYLSAFASTNEPAQQVPDGWKLVPIEPTDAMIEVGCENNPTQWNEGTDSGFAADVANDVYVSMVRASAFPSTESGGGK